MNEFDRDDHIETLKIMLAGLLMAVLLNLPVINYFCDKNWSWAQGFPLGWLSVSLNYMGVMFHELGHTIAYWFYGYVTLPSFDFTHGGGMAYAITDQLVILNVALYAFLIYMFLQLHEYPAWRIAIVVLAVFHVATAYTSMHRVVSVFAGPLAPVIMGSFLLTRAWLDMAPRGIIERVLNAVFGFGMIFETLITNWLYAHDDVARQIYYEQKGSHAAGDFDRIVDILDFRFSNIVYFLMLLAVIGLILPVIFYIKIKVSSAKHTGI